MQKEKQINLEILRIIACFLVIVNHTNSRIFLSIEPSKTWFISLTYFFICKIAVPIFVMISGAVLLKKIEPYKDVLIKRIGKILIILIFFSFFYYIDTVILTGKSSLNLVTFFISVYKVRITNAYWYLYMYLGLMFMLPMLRKMVSNFSNHDYTYFIIIWVIYICILPLINIYFPASKVYEKFEIPVFGGYVGYFIIGDLIQNKIDKKWINRKGMFISWLLFIVFSAMSVILTYLDYKIHGKITLFMDNNYLITIVVPSISIFYLSIYYSSRIYIQNAIKKTILLISECTLGIYLLSDFFIEKLDFIYNFSVQHMFSLIAILILEISVFISGFFITIILKRIPVIKRII